jgi:ribosomal protein S18 acetylase RimI-like enzyme
VLEGSTIIGALVGFDTNDLNTHFFHKIFVDAESRGRGVGNLLLTAYTSHLDRSGKASLMTVAPANAASVKLGSAHGFTTVEFVSGFYGPSEDRLVRRREPVLAS